MDQILQLAGIPILTAVVCIFFSIKLLVFKDTDSIRGNMDRKLKDKDNYARYAGLLLLLFGICSLIMAALLFVNMTAALVQIAICVLITALLWRKVEENYGAD